MDRSDENVLALRRQALDWRELEGEVIAIERASSTYLTTNRTGAALWRALSGGASVGELVRLLVEEFGITSARAQADVDGFLTALDRRGLLVRA